MTNKPQLSLFKPWQNKTAHLHPPPQRKCVASREKKSWDSDTGSRTRGCWENISLLRSESQRCYRYTIPDEDGFRWGLLRCRARIGLIKLRLGERSGQSCQSTYGHLGCKINLIVMFCARRCANELVGKKDSGCRSMQWMWCATEKGVEAVEKKGHPSSPQLWPYR